jgi:hypothetical protein
MLPCDQPTQRAYTITEVVVATFVLGVLTVSLFGAFSSGIALVQMSRENLRATQILTQKMEALRLLTWTQAANPSVATPVFSEWYVPSTTGGQGFGTLYHGVVDISPAPESIPADYRDAMRLVTVTLYWTNYLHGSSSPIVRSRQMQTQVARYGMQNYICR